jgi:hypothetical protein
VEQMKQGSSGGDCAGDLRIVLTIGLPATLRHVEASGDRDPCNVQISGHLQVHQHGILET